MFVELSTIVRGSFEFRAAPRGCEHACPLLPMMACAREAAVTHTPSLLSGALQWPHAIAAQTAVAADTAVPEWPPAIMPGSAVLDCLPAGVHM